MPWLGGLADACYGKVIWPTHATARQTTRSILRQGELPGAYCGKENLDGFVQNGPRMWCLTSE